MLQLIELEKMRNFSYENDELYKKRTKAWHDSNIQKRDLKEGDNVLLFNSRLNLFPGMLNSRWFGPFTISKVHPHGAVDIKIENYGNEFKVNGQRVEQYLGETMSRAKATTSLSVSYHKRIHSG